MTNYLIGWAAIAAIKSPFPKPQLKWLSDTAWLAVNYLIYYSIFDLLSRLMDRF